MLCEFHYVPMACDDWWAGMYYKPKGPNPPEPFEPFNFFIETAPDYAYEIFNIPSNIMFKAALEAGYEKIDFELQQPNPEYEKDPAIRRYIDEVGRPDYIMKL